MRLRVIASATVVAAIAVGASVPALAQSEGEVGPPLTLPPVTLPPVTLPPVTLPPVTLPPIVPPPSVPPPSQPPLPNPPVTPPGGVPTVPNLPAPGVDTPIPSLPGGSPTLPAAGGPSQPGVGGGLGTLGSLAGSADALGTLGGSGLPTDLLDPGAGIPPFADLAALQFALDTALDTVTTTVCTALTTLATTLEPVTGPVTDAVGDLPVPPVGTGLGGALGLRLDLQALSELPARTFLDLSVGLPGLLTVRLTLPGCAEDDGAAVTPPTGPSRGPGSELIPPTGIARRLQIPGTTTAVMRPAPALAGNPAFTG